MDIKHCSALWPLQKPHGNLEQIPLKLEYRWSFISLSYTYVWENTSWSVVFLISFVILFKNRPYISIFQTISKKNMENC